MAARLNPAGNQEILWKIAYPADGDNTAETHCAICMEPDDSKTILGHSIVRNNGQVDQNHLTHRVHQTCLLAFHRDVCPQCEIPYRRDEIPRPLSERLIEQGKIIGWRIGTQFAIYFGAGMIGFLSADLIEFSVGLIKGFSLAFPISGVVVGSLIGTVVGSLACCLIGDSIMQLGIRVVDRINPENPDARLAILVTAAALSSLATTALIFGSIYLFHSRMGSSLSSGALKVLNAPRLFSPNGLPLACYKAGLMGLTRVFGFGMSSLSIWATNLFLNLEQIIKEDNRRNDLFLVRNIGFGAA